MKLKKYLKFLSKIIKDKVYILYFLSSTLVMLTATNINITV